MGPIFEGDGWFCVIAIIVSELLADIPWLSAQMRLPGILFSVFIFLSPSWKPFLPLLPLPPELHHFHQ